MTKDVSASSAATLLEAPNPEPCCIKKQCHPGYVSEEGPVISGLLCWYNGGPEHREYEASLGHVVLVLNKAVGQQGSHRVYKEVWKGDIEPFQKPTGRLLNRSPQLTISSMDGFEA